MSRYDHKIETSLEGIEHQSKSSSKVKDKWKLRFQKFKVMKEEISLGLEDNIQGLHSKKPTLESRLAIQQMRFFRWHSPSFWVLTVIIPSDLPTNISMSEGNELL